MNILGINFVIKISLLFYYCYLVIKELYIVKRFVYLIIFSLYVVLGKMKNFFFGVFLFGYK